MSYFSQDVESYPTMIDLFTRQLKEGSRQIDSMSMLTSPCDGKVLSCGEIDEYGYIEQIKGLIFD
jgi:phosphatidylserine decarboxylase